jgi:hypothetical protein
MLKAPPAGDGVHGRTFPSGRRGGMEVEHGFARGVGGLILKAGLVSMALNVHIVAESSDMRFTVKLA